MRLLKEPKSSAFATAGVGLLAVAAAGTLVLALQAHGAPAPSSTTSTAAQNSAVDVSGVNAAKPLAAWIGDTWISGINAGGLGAGIAAKASTQLGYSWLTASQPETGWASAGLAGVQGLNTPFPQRVPAIVADKPALVVVAGGSNDAVRGASSEAITAGVRQTVTALRAGLGAAEPIVVVGPTWPSPDVPASVTAVDTTVRAEAAALKVPFVDPLAERWITAANAGTYEGKGFLTAAGNTALAARFVTDARALGVPVEG